MVETFRNLGVEAVPGVGHPFDPNFHEAIVSEPNDDVPDGTVLQEFRKGFQCGDRLIRPAMVKVHTLKVNTSAFVSSPVASLDAQSVDSQPSLSVVLSLHMMLAESGC